MSDCSFFARTLYDNCAYHQELNQSTSPLSYALLVDNFENVHNSNIVFPCSGVMLKAPCKKCEANKEANITNTFASVPQRVDIESDLKLINYKLSRCGSEKYLPCNSYGTKIANKKSNKPVDKLYKIIDNKVCKKVIPTVALLCEREIVPTNMKMPVDSGLSHIR